MAPTPDAGAGPHLEELPFDVCIGHLASRQVGRLVVVVDHYPMAFPVNYRMDDAFVVFRTDPGTMHEAAHHRNVGFQIDHLDTASSSGWSVLVVGTAEDVADRPSGDWTADRARQLEVRPWAPGEKSRLMRIIPAHVSGRAITPTSTLWPTDGRGYL